MLKNKELLSKFTNLLQAHDWFFDFSDDHRVWTQGRDEKDSLLAMAKALVAQGMDSIEVAQLWNEFAPSRFGAEPFQFETPKPKPQRVFLNKLNRPSMGEVVKLKNELGISASEANFRLKFGVEPSDVERDIAQAQGGRFILHFPSHPEIWEWQQVCP
ncbi:MAG: hypothetical protein CL512_05740 [Actinobacteria bacterium]|nr:hypothetical protein [Actinomycetota bacterium]